MRRNDRPRGRRDERRLTPEQERAQARAREQSAAIEHEPQRTCIVTKHQKAPAAMLRVAWVEGELIAGPKGGGRGAYVTIDRKVLDQLDAKTLSRAFRAQVSSFDTEGFLRDLHAMAERRVLDALGLARRTGILVTGTENVPAKEADGVLIVASDLAERTTQKLSHGTVFATGAILGAATGTGFLGAAFIPGKSHHITNEAAYWLAVWYESRPAGSDRNDQPVPAEQNEASHG